MYHDCQYHQEPKKRLICIKIIQNCPKMTEEIFKDMGMAQIGGCR